MGCEKTFGYIRISSSDQNLERQREAMLEYGIAERDIIEDIQSGKNFDRKGYMLLKETLLRPGDTLVIKELDRLGRNMEQMKTEWKELKDMGVNLVVLDTPILNTKNVDGIDTSFMADIVLNILSYVAEKERINSKKRQREGIERAKKRGVKFGKDKIQRPDMWEMFYIQWKAGKITATEMMKALDLKRTTFYKLVKEFEEECVNKKSSTN